MPFSIRPYRRFPVQCAVTYDAGPFQVQGTIRNLSCTGWRLSGDLPLCIEQSFPTCVNPIRKLEASNGCLTGNDHCTIGKMPSHTSLEVAPSSLSFTCPGGSLFGTAKVGREVPVRTARWREAKHEARSLDC
jgi:hypothetical protein